MTHGYADDAPASAHVMAHAKINLVLRVLAREASGYHSIETLFQALELADVVDVHTVEADRTLDVSGPTLPAAGLGNPADNLATRAALAYADATRWDTGWHISIQKNIPVGGGLGGGSADAAAVLRALESLSPQPLGTSALMELAGGIGADVPFLLSGAPLAWGWGRGGRLLPLPALPRMDVGLLAFDDGVATAAAYRALAAEREANAQGASVACAYPPGAFESWASVLGLATNDFEHVVPSLHAGVGRWLPVVREAAARLRSRGTPALGLMSGSGATCFLLAAPGSLPDLGGGTGMRVLKTHTMTAMASL